ncbi:MAG: cation diffusion facilitator family transporter [Candidatus Omnitrophica bacterium]|nr:cation diffusion facilitator family transporter [Candidatus Omnitrophota bacterium]
MIQDKRFHDIRKVLIAVLVLNWLVSFMKVIYGIMTGCASMRADGLHSFSDGASNIIGLIGIWVASQPVDKDHPYGHKKYETFSAVGIAILLILLCVQILHGAFSRISNPVVPEVTAISFIIMAVTMAVNLFVIWYEVKKSKELTSDILYSDAMHTRSDVLVSFSVIATLVGMKMGWYFLDTSVAVIIAALIGYAAFKILKESSYVLCDTAPIMSDSIKRIVMQVDGVKACHQIRTRGRSDDIYIDLHILVKPNMHVGTAHDITETIENKIKEKMPGVADVVVHVEPQGHD